MNTKAKLFVIGLFISLAFSLSVAARAPVGDGKSAGGNPPLAQETMAVDGAVVISVCVEAGGVTVRGWERSEVRARSADAGKIELRRVEQTSAPGNPTAPPTRIEVLAYERDQVRPPTQDNCSGVGSLELSVPRGSSVQLKAPSGAISVTDVANVRAETLSGEIELSGITDSVEALSGNGVILLERSTGKVSLRSISGEITLASVRPSQPGDGVVIKTTGGDVTLEDVRHARVFASTTNGSITFEGPLTPGGAYDLKTHSGDIALTLPSATAFQLNAKVYQHGAIDTEFPIRQLPGASIVLKDGRLAGLHGDANAQTATLNLTSFNGTLELRRK